MTQIIKSLSNEHIKSIAKLNNKKFSKESNVFVVEGKHLVDEAYKRGLLTEVLSTEETKYTGVKQILVTEEIIKKISDTINPQGIIGLVMKRSEIKIDDVSNYKSIIILDGVSDPGNVGTIIRTASGFDIDLIVLGTNCVDIFNPKVIRATQGAIFDSNILITDLVGFVQKIKEKGFKIYSTALQNSVDLNTIGCDDMKKCAFIMGNEANGVSNQLINISDKSVKIDISNKIESLNVSIAAAIVMFYLSNKNKGN